MSRRPGAASASAASAAPRVAPASAAISPALTALRGASSSTKNFGPPTLQSDTVVFQAAKIPLSSARLASAPGSAGMIVAPSRGGRGRGESGYTEREIGPRRGSHGQGSSVGRSGYDRPAVSSVHQQQRSSAALEHVSSYTEMPPQRQPRSPPPPASRERAGGYPGEVPSVNGLTPPHRPPPCRRDSAGRSGRGEGEFAHLMEDAAAAVAAGARPRGLVEGAAPTQKAQKSTQKRSRPSSADSKGSSAGQGGIVRLTVRVMKDGDKLGFGIRNDSNRKLKVSTLQTNSTASKSTLQIGDTILSVNGIDLTDMGFLEVIQQLKATKPGELVFDIERSLDEDESFSGGEGSQQGETMDLDSPLSVAEKRFGPSATRSSPGPLPPQAQRRPEATQMPQQSRQGAVTPPAPVAVAQQRLSQRERPPNGGPVGLPAGVAAGMERLPPADAQAGDSPVTGMVAEPPRKRPRPASMTPAQVDMELARMDKQHRTVLNALSLELKKERTEKLSLEEKNTVLRKRLQNMLIECDEVRVKAGSAVASIKEHAQRDITELRQALQAARAQLRLQDRGPDVARTDSIVNDLLATKEQLNRLRKLEMERATNLSTRYGLESRQAGREANRTREQLIGLLTAQLRDVARRNYNNNGVRTGGKEGANSNIVVQWEGLRKLAFVKMFGLPCTYEWYTSDDFHSTTLIRHSLRKQDDVIDVFGNTLCHEERAGLFIVACAPMNVAYDNTNEKLTLSCGWTEQNQLRELARNFRF